MRALFVLLFLVWFGAKAQNYSYRLATYVNVMGNEAPMAGVPGDVFMANLTFSNSSASTIYVVMNRYKNDHPSYWAICYCYLQCHSPKEDSILIELLPFSTADVTLQFKTDSVNPGSAHNSFKIHESGSNGAMENLDMTATTKTDVGLREEVGSGSVSLYPNPATDHFNLISQGRIRKVSIYSIDGKLIFTSLFEENQIEVSTKEIHPGLYQMGVWTDGAPRQLRFVKQ